MPDCNRSCSTNRLPVFFITFAGNEGGPQAWFAQLVAHPAFQQKIDAKIWRPEDIYRGARGKFRLLAHCREKYRIEGQPRIIYVSLDLDFAAQIVFCLWLAGARNIIMHAHATRFGTDNSLKFRIYRWLARNIADRKAAVSEAAALGMFGQRLDRVSLLPAFIDYGALLSSSTDTPVEFEAVSWSDDLEDCVVFACVGRFAESKNLQLAVEAFGRFRHDSPNVNARLLLIGSGPEEQKLREQSKKAGLEDQVHITGWIGNVEWVYRHVVDCLLMPSLHEGAPRAVLEAQAFGCSVIVSEAVPEFCLYRDDLAARLPNLDSDKWANEMGRIAKRGKKTVGDSIEIARRHPLFSIDHGIGKFLQILQPDRT